MLKELLLYNINLADKIDTFLSDVALMYLLPVFMLAVVWEFFTTNNLNQIGKNFLISALLIFSFTKVYKLSVDYSFDIADEIILKKGGVRNSFVKTWKKLIQSKKETKFDKFKSLIDIVRGSDDLFLNFVSALVVFVFLLTSVFYTLGFYLNFIFIGISALIGILPLGKNILAAPVKGLLWSCIVPIVIASIIALMGSIFDLDTSGRSLGFQNYLEVMTLALSLFFVLPGVYLFLNGSTFGEISTKMAETAGKGSMYYLGATGVSSGMTTVGLSKRPLMAGARTLGRTINQASLVETKKANIDESNQKNTIEPRKISEILQKNINKDIESGRGIVSSMIRPKNHIDAFKDKGKEIHDRVSQSSAALVYKNKLESSGKLKAIKSAGIVATASAIKYMAAPKNINQDLSSFDYKNNPNKTKFKKYTSKPKRDWRKK